MLNSWHKKTKVCDSEFHVVEDDVVVESTINHYQTRLLKLFGG